MMDKATLDGPAAERRSEQRTLTGKYHSVQFSVGGLPQLYQFKIRDMSTQGLCILVRQDSNILPHLCVGDILEMEYQTGRPEVRATTICTRINHLTRQNSGRFKGHCLIGLSLVDADPKTDETPGV